MQEKMPAEIRARRFDAVKYNKKFMRPAKVKKLTSHLTSFVGVIACGNVRGSIGVFRCALESHDMASLARQAIALVHVAQQAAIVFVAFVAPEFFGRVEDGDDIENERTPGVIIGVIVALAALARYERTAFAD